MPGLTPVRVRLSVEQKVKIIEESKKKGFCRKDICEKYGISAATLSQILKNQKVHLSTFDSGLPGKHKTIRKSALPNVEEALYEWFLKLTRQNVPVSVLFIKKSLEQSNYKQTKLTNYFNVNQLTLK